MLKCEICGYIGSKNEVKKAPKFFPKYAGKLICFDCYSKLKNKDGNNLKEENNKIRCIYCGSPIQKDTDICPHCMYDYNKKKVIKREKPVKTGFKKSNEANKDPIVFDDKVILPKKIKFLSIIPVVLIFVMIFLVANQYGLLATIVNTSDNIEISGKYNLEEMKESADDNFTQTWIFYENKDTLKIETEYNDDSSEIKLGEGNKFVNYYNYEL